MIIDYRVSGAEQGGSFAILAETVLDTTYTVTGLIAGTIYEFKVEARNSYSHSSFSDVLTLLAAFKPEAPSAPSTETVDSQVYISWPEAEANGSPLTGYKVFIRESDQTTFTEVTCTSTPTLESCFIDLYVLITSPFNLELNGEIWAKVVATNVYGDSLASEAGNGALTKLVPDAPVSLENNAAITDAFNIGLTWLDGPSDGG